MKIQITLNTGLLGHIAGWLGTSLLFLVIFVLVCDFGILVRYKLYGYLARSNFFAFVVLIHFNGCHILANNQELTILPKFCLLFAKFLLFIASQTSFNPSNKFSSFSLGFNLFKGNCFAGRGLFLRGCWGFFADLLCFYHALCKDRV